MTTTALDDLYAGFASDSALERSHRFVSFLMAMPPGAESVHRGGRWAQTRSQALGDGRTLHVVISCDAQGVLNVTSHDSAGEMAKA